MTAPRPTVHANCVVVGEAGLLIRGPSGSGKSSVSAALIELARSQGRFARLVADDRVRLEAHNGRLLASPPTAIAGLIERRGLGVVAVDFLAGAVIALVVDLEPSPGRMPEDDELSCAIEGILLPRLAISPAAKDVVSLTLSRLRTVAADCVPTALAFAPQDGKVTDTMVTPSQSRSGRARAARRGPCSERNEFCAETQ
jgi:hypothetical protein